MTSIVEPWYVTREEVMDAMDFRESTLRTSLIDSAIAGASRDVDENLCHRTFYPVDTTRKFNWPNFQRAYPWRIWLERSEIADITTNVPVVKSGGNLIPNSAIRWGPWDIDAPPYTFFELDRAQSYSFGQGSTPQQDVTVQATFGFWTKTEVRGSLVTSINSAVTTVQGTDGSIDSGLGIGDILLIGTERMLINGKKTVDSADTLQSGCTTKSVADDILGVTDGTSWNIGEQVLVDSERMYVRDIAGNTLLVRRAWGGTTLATHTVGAKLYVYRNFTVQRGALGTTAAAHTQGDVLYRYAIPGPVRELSLAESINNVLQKTSGYARTVGAGDNLRNASGAGLKDLRSRVYAGYGRQGRIGVI